MGRLDRWLIERVFEPAAWEASRWGVEPFNIARFLVVASLAGTITEAMWDRTVLYVTIAAGASVVTILRVWWLSRIERQVMRRGLANPEKYQAFDIALRSVLVLVNGLSVLLIVLLWQIKPIEVGNICFVLHLYFSACDRPPPVEQRAPDALFVPEGA